MITNSSQRKERTQGELYHLDLARCHFNEETLAFRLVRSPYVLASAASSALVALSYEAVARLTAAPNSSDNIINTGMGYFGLAMGTVYSLAQAVQIVKLAASSDECLDTVSGNRVDYAVTACRATDLDQTSKGLYIFGGMFGAVAAMTKVAPWLASPKPSNPYLLNAMEKVVEVLCNVTMHATLPMAVACGVQGALMAWTANKLCNRTWHIIRPPTQVGEQISAPALTP